MRSDKLVLHDRINRKFFSGESGLSENEWIAMIESNPQLGKIFTFNGYLKIYINRQYFENMNKFGASAAKAKALNYAEQLAK